MPFEFTTLQIAKTGSTATKRYADQDCAFPNGFVACDLYPTGGGVVLYQPPTVRTIKVMQTTSASLESFAYLKKHKSYTLAIPPLVFILGRFASTTTSKQRLQLFVYGVNGPVKSLNAKLYRPPLLNVEFNGGVCLGGVNMPTQEGREVDALMLAVDVFWSRAFNATLAKSAGVYQAHNHAVFKSIDEWAKQTQKNPDIVLQAPFAECDYAVFGSLGALLRRLRMVPY